MGLGPNPPKILHNSEKPILSKKLEKSAKSFCSKSAEMKILLCKVDMRNKFYETKFFELCCKKMELMKQIHLFKKGFVIFLKGAPFSDFIETGL